MKKMISLLLALVVLTGSVSALADTLTLPAGLTRIEEEAFYGDESLDEVELSEGLKYIGPRAFGESSLESINLPSTLEEISDDAIDKGVKVSAEEGTKAYEWATDNGFMTDKIKESSPLEWFEFSDNGDGTCQLTKYVGPKGNSADIVIPAKDGNGRKVTSVLSQSH